MASRNSFSRLLIGFFSVDGASGEAESGFNDGLVGVLGSGDGKDGSLMSGMF